MPSCEDQVYEAVLAWFGGRPGCQIVSSHPPSAKAYGSDLIRIPVLRDGAATRDRNHIDAIIAEGPCLFLVEFKCRLSESTEDASKLRAIRDTYSVAALLQLITRRLTVALDLAAIRHLVLGLGVRDLDISIDWLPDFVIFTSAVQPISTLVGPQVAASAVRLFA